MSNLKIVFACFIDRSAEEANLIKKTKDAFIIVRL